MQPNFDCSFGNPQRRAGFANIHFFDVSEQYNVTVNLGKTGDGRAEQLSKFFALQGLEWVFPASW